MNKDATRRFTYEISPKAMRSLQMISADLCEAANNSTGAASISPLVQAIGSGLFSIVPRINTQTVATDAIESNQLTDLTSLTTSNSSSRTEVGGKIDRDPYQPKQCCVHIDRNAHWGMKSVANIFCCKTSGGCRRRQSVSVFLNELGLGIYSVLPIPDIQIRYLYLQSESLIQEYLAIKAIVDESHRKNPAGLNDRITSSN